MNFLKRKPVSLNYVVGCFMIFFLASCLKNDRYSAPAITVNKCVGQPGPLFIAARVVITQNCIQCHNDNFQNGGMNWTVDCNIITFSGRIRARAVDEGSMPPTGPLSQGDKNKILAWINAGGAITN